MFHPSDTLAENSRIWIYQSDRTLSSEEQNILRTELEKFVAEWTAHNVALVGSYEILHDRFLVIMLDENHTSASGCSIDKCFNFLKKMEDRFKLSFMNRMLLAYKDKSEIKVLPKNKFEELIREGMINEDTIVFNNLIEKKSDLLKNWQVPLKDSWHKIMLS